MAISFRRISLRTSLIVVAIICLALAADNAATMRGNALHQAITEGANILEVPHLNKNAPESKNVIDLNCEVQSPTLTERFCLTRRVTAQYSYQDNDKSFAASYMRKAEFKTTLFGRSLVSDEGMGFFSFY